MPTPAPSSGPLVLPATAVAQEWVEARAATGLGEARVLVEALLERPPSAAMEALRAWDEITLRLGNVAAMGSLFSNVHPLEGVRDAAEQAEQEVSRRLTELSLDRRLYEVFAGLDAAGLEERDPLAARLLAKVCDDFRRSGVDRDQATRDRIAAVSDRLTELDQQLGKHTRDDVRTVHVAPDRLGGLPQDWRDAHPARGDGLVRITTDYPDTVPVRMFAHDAGLRAEVTRAFLSRGYPDNEARLREMFDLRHELATLVGFADWASYDAGRKMIGEGPAIPAFIDKIAAAAEEPMRRDLAVLLERYRRDLPDAETVALPDASYYEETVRREQLQVDAQQVRRYFDATKVQRGLLDVTSRLFGVRYEAVPDAPVWAEDVTCYDVYDASSPSAPSAADGSGEDLIGRIYLDLHPRQGKYKHAAQFTLTNGVAGRQLPEGVLVCNFSRGLMEHSHVVTLFHEFGHLVHHVLGGRGPWSRFSGVATEWDFVEAPSQMLEEWAWNATVLRSFATDADGEPIPADLVERMRAGDDFGKGYHARTQMFYAAVSYWFHQERPEDLTEAMKRLQARYSPFPYLEGTHFFASFGHLGGYSSAYYTYAWSLVIAKDLLSAFDPDDLLDPVVAGRYRDRVLAPGGSRDAADLVADFLGRPYTFDAYAAWLAG